MRDKLKETSDSKFKKVEGLNIKQVKEYSLLGEMGLDDLIPIPFRNKFTKRDEHGNH